ncbi:MAG: hypothetical protein AB8A40_05680 [Prochlorococcus sp.]|jgi:hypothetical protein
MTAALKRFSRNDYELGQSKGKLPTKKQHLYQVEASLSKKKDWGLPQT